MFLAPAVPPHSRPLLFLVFRCSRGAAGSRPVAASEMTLLPRMPSALLLLLPIFSSARAQVNPGNVAVARLQAAGPARGRACRCSSLGKPCRGSGREQSGSIPPRLAASGTGVRSRGGWSIRKPVENGGRGSSHELLHPLRTGGGLGTPAGWLSGVVAGSRLYLFVLRVTLSAPGPVGSQVGSLSYRMLPG